MTIEEARKTNPEGLAKYSDAEIQEAILCLKELAHITLRMALEEHEKENQSRD